MKGFIDSLVALFAKCVVDIGADNRDYTEPGLAYFLEAPLTPLLFIISAPGIG